MEMPHDISSLSCITHSVKMKVGLLHGCTAAQLFN